MRQPCFGVGSPGTPNPMFESQEEETDGGTTPEEPTHEATTPPGNGEPDEGAVEQAEDKLDQAGGGH